MRQINLYSSNPDHRDPARTARLTRHLKARLEDFGPGGPEVVSAHEDSGIVTVRFPGHETAQVLRRLSGECGIRAGQEGDLAVFRLDPSVRFEDLDYVWGCLFDLLE